MKVFEGFFPVTCDVQVQEIRGSRKLDITYFKDAFFTCWQFTETANIIQALKLVFYKTNKFFKDNLHAIKANILQPAPVTSILILSSHIWRTYPRDILHRYFATNVLYVVSLFLLHFPPIISLSFYCPYCFTQNAKHKIPNFVSFS